MCWIVLSFFFFFLEEDFSKEMLAVLQEGTKRPSDVAHMKIWKKVLAAFRLLFAFGLEQYLFQKIMSVKPPDPVAERLGMEWFCLCSASCNDTCLSA